MGLDNIMRAAYQKQLMRVKRYMMGSWGTPKFTIHIHMSTPGDCRMARLHMQVCVLYCRSRMLHVSIL